MAIPGFLVTVARLTVANDGENLARRGRQVVALFIAAAMLSIPALVFASPTSNAKITTGLIMVDGTVIVNSTPAKSAQTLFSGSTVSTAADSQSIIDFGNSARLRLNSESSVSIEFSQSTFSGSLNQGSFDYAAPAGITTMISTADSQVVADSASPAHFTVQVIAGTTLLSVTTGKVELHKGDSTRSVSAGETLSTAPDASALPQGNSMSNGKKAGLIILFGGVAAVIIWIIIHNHNKCTLIVSGTGAGTCQ